MKIIKHIIVAFSLYSRIPMPHFEWKDDDTEHVLVFLPWIGAIIGLLLYTAHFLLNEHFTLISELCIYSLIPLMVTGGFHMDGYMDVQDALSSYKPPEEKLKILSDPHIGSFAIIRLVMFALIWCGSLPCIINQKDPIYLYSYFCIFVLARIQTAILCLKLKRAKKTGLLHMEAQKSSKVDILLCALQGIVVLAIMVKISIWIGIISFSVCVCHGLYIRHMCYKQFGGATGDVAGYSIVTLEECLIVAIAIMTFVI